MRTQLPASLLAVLLLTSASAQANSGDFSGGVAIGSGYAGVNTAPTNGLIVQGNVGIGTTAVSGFPAAELQVEAGTNLDNTTTAGGDVWSSGSLAVNDNRSFAQYVGGGITFNGYDDAGGDYSTFGWIRGFKNNSTSGDATGGLIISTRSGNLVIKTQTGSGTLDDLTTGTSMVITAGGKVGIGTSSPAQALEVNGEVQIDSFASASATTVCKNGNVLSVCSSAGRYKEKVKSATFGLKEVMAMRPVTFKWKDRDEQDFGLIAEDVEKVDPLFVTYEHGQIEGVKYPQLTAVLIEAMQEQQAEIDKLKQMVNKLRTGDDPKSR